MDKYSLCFFFLFLLRKNLWASTVFGKTILMERSQRAPLLTSSQAFLFGAQTNTPLLTLSHKTNHLISSSPSLLSSSILSVSLNHVAILQIYHCSSHLLIMIFSRIGRSLSRSSRARVSFFVTHHFNSLIYIQKTLTLFQLPSGS